MSEATETISVGRRARHIHTGVEGRVYKLDTDNGRDIAWIQRDNGARGWYPLADLRPVG
jgi:hypothetical protein